MLVPDGSVPAVECSGHGSCLRIPDDVSCVRNAGLSIGCAVVCTCSSGWHGRACDISIALLQSVQDVRASALAVLLSSLQQLETATPDEAEQAFSVISGLY